MKFRALATTAATLAVLLCATACGTGNLANNAYGLNRSNAGSVNSINRNTDADIVRDGNAGRGTIGRNPINRDRTGPVGATARTQRGGYNTDYQTAGRAMSDTNRTDRYGVGNRLGNALHTARNTMNNGNIAGDFGGNMGINRAGAANRMSSRVGRGFIDYNNMDYGFGRTDNNGRNNGFGRFDNNVASVTDIDNAARNTGQIFDGVNINNDGFPYDGTPNGVTTARDGAGRVVDSVRNSNLRYGYDGAYSNSANFQNTVYRDNAVTQNDDTRPSGGVFVNNQRQDLGQGQGQRQTGRNMVGSNQTTRTGYLTSDNAAFDGTTVRNGANTAQNTTRGMAGTQQRNTQSRVAAGNNSLIGGR